jgi:fructose-bisphosphate aldolase class II
MQHRTTAEIIENARRAGTVVPAFNIPYLPMMEPVVEAIRDARSFALIAVARLEWIKFEAGSLRAVCEEYGSAGDERHTRLHLDHVPVIDEDDERVDYLAILREAVELGYDSVMVDGSRLSLAENIAATRRVVEMAHAADVPVEAELGAILGHEEGPLPPYEEMFESGRGFTDPEEAVRFVRQTGVDWLSVAVGSVHGAISEARKDEEKIAARLDVGHLDRIHRAVDIPLVLHGGTGIPQHYILEAVRHGIAKINVATALRQPYERAIEDSIEKAQQAAYDATMRVLREDLQVEGTVDTVNPPR